MSVRERLMTNLLTPIEARVGPVTGVAGLPKAELSEMLRVMYAGAGAGAGCKTTWRAVCTGVFLAGALFLAFFGSANVRAQGMALDICPTDYGSLPENAPPLTCGCSAAAVKTGTVWGTNPYYYQSALCRAALHAGAIGAEGGQIVVQPLKSAFYPAVTRNGIRAASSKGGMGFSVAAKAGSGQAGSPVFDA